MKVGIVGFGNVGKYLFKEILEHGKELGLEVVFVWNRTASAMHGTVPEHLILENLNQFDKIETDLIVEVAHPDITKKFGEQFLKHCNFFVGSPTAFADSLTEETLRQGTKTHSHCVYVPSGAFWGATDIQKMADRGTLKGLKVTMKKHPSAFRLSGDLKRKNDALLQSGDGSIVLFEGPVRDLCPLAPNNVNTMAAAAIAGHNLGFDKVVGCLVSDCRLSDRHIVEVEVTGPASETGNDFKVTTTRVNPAAVKAVTGSATYASFFSSLIRARNQAPGVHLC